MRSVFEVLAVRIAILLTYAFMLYVGLEIGAYISQKDIADKQAEIQMQRIEIMHQDIQLKTCKEIIDEIQFQIRCNALIQELGEPKDGGKQSSPL